MIMKTQAMTIKNMAVVITALATILFSSCTIHVGEKKSDEKTTAKQFDLKDFNKIQISGEADIDFAQDSIYKVEASTTTEGFEQMELTVKDSTLCLSRKGNGKFVLKNGNSVKLRITAPDLKAIHVSGACEFDSYKINTSEFSAHVSGAGEFDIKNLTAEKVDFSISGAGEVEAHLIDCGDVEVSVSGAGDIELSGNARSFTKHTSGVASINTNGLEIK